MLYVSNLYLFKLRLVVISQSNDILLIGPPFFDEMIFSG